MWSSSRPVKRPFSSSGNCETPSAPLPAERPSGPPTLWASKQINLGSEWKFGVAIAGYYGAPETAGAVNCPSRRREGEGREGKSRRVFVDLRQYSRTNLHICCAFCGLLLCPFSCFEVYVEIQNVLSNPVLNVLES